MPSMRGKLRNSVAKPNRISKARSKYHFTSLTYIGKRTYDYHPDTSPHFILRRWNRLSCLVSRAWGGGIGDNHRQVLLHQLPSSATFFRIPQPHLVFESREC